MRVLGDVDEVLTTTRTVRHRLDFERPVEREVLEECLRMAQQSTMGSNVEEWRAVAVYDQAKKSLLAELYRDTYEEMVARPFRERDQEVLARLNPGARDNVEQQRRQSRVMSGVKFLADNLERVPVLTYFSSTTPAPPAAVGKLASGFYGSIFPMIWSFQLAARSRGLGTVLATAAVHHAREISELLELPRNFILVAMVPVAYTIGTDFKPAVRLPLSSILRYNEWN